MSGDRFKLQVREREERGSRDTRRLRTNGCLIDGNRVNRFPQRPTFLHVLRDKRFDRRARFAQDSVDLLFLCLAHAEFDKFSEQGMSKRVWRTGVVCPDGPGDSDKAGKRNGPGTR